MLRYYQMLIRLRKQHPALRHLNRQQLAVTVQEEQQTLVLHRWHEDQHVRCLLNFSSEPQTVSVPVDGGSWQKLLDSADPQWQGADKAEPSSAPDSIPDNNVITLSPESIVIYSLNDAKNENA
jgi:maltooligosyltrehalose trehalohydrolase